MKLSRPRSGRRKSRKPRPQVKPAASQSKGGVQYTVRNVPSTVDAALRRKAAEEKKSLNEVLRQALMNEVGSAVSGKRVHNDLDHLAGTWVEDPEFDAAIALQDVIEKSLWK